MTDCLTGLNTMIPAGGCERRLSPISVKMLHPDAGVGERMHREGAEAAGAPLVGSPVVANRSDMVVVADGNGRGGA